MAAPAMTTGGAHAPAPWYKHLYVQVLVRHRARHPARALLPRASAGR